MIGICRALVLGLVFVAGTAIEQSPSVGSLNIRHGTQVQPIQEEEKWPT